MHKFKENESTITRAEFLKTTALAGAAAGGLALLSGCSPGGGDSAGDNWDREVDLLIVGSGTVAWAALSGKDAGIDSILIIEKTNTWGGTSAVSGGGLYIPLAYPAADEGVEDNREDAIEYMTAVAEGRMPAEMIENYVDNANAFLEWSRDTYDWQWGFKNRMYQDYYELYPGSLDFGRGAVSPTDMAGPQAWQKLREQIEAADIEIMMETPATSLVTDADGRVTGAVATNGDNEIRIGARMGVILGTGGFDHNAEMRKQYLPFPIFVTNAAQGNTGDGHRMGLTVGAALANMPFVWGLPNFIITPNDNPDEITYDFTGNDWAQYRGKPGAIVVNKRGRRFGNEGAAYDVFNRSFEKWDSGLMEYENIPAYFICDSTFTTYYTLPGGDAPGVIPEWMTQANSLQELATALNIDPDGLAAEVQAFNQNASQGVDPVFHRGETTFDKVTSGDTASRTDLANPALAPLATPPFYGAQYGPGTCGTNGGLLTNVNAQVLNRDGDPIPGLYAVGNCSAAVASRYAGGGMTVGQGSIMAWLAARHAAGEGS